MSPWPTPALSRCLTSWQACTVPAYLLGCSFKQGKEAAPTQYTRQEPRASGDSQAAGFLPQWKLLLGILRQLVKWKFLRHKIISLQFRPPSPSRSAPTFNPSHYSLCRPRKGSRSPPVHFNTERQPGDYTHCTTSTSYSCGWSRMAPTGSSDIQVV